jgi:ribonuclease Z
MKWLREIVNAGRLVPLVVLALLQCMPDDISATTGSDEMRVTLLGTGTPFPNAQRFGSAILVQVADKKLLFDCGRGGVIRLMQAGVSPKDIDGLFLTHLHSDHVVGIPDLWLTGWFLGRSKPLPIWGPQGTSSMAKYLAQAFAFDIHIREAAPDLFQAKAWRSMRKKSTRAKYITTVQHESPRSSSIMEL